MKFARKTNRTFSAKEILAHHDLVYRAPVCDKEYGIPLGDGSTGLLLWLSEEALHVQINNSDLMDDMSPEEEFCIGTMDWDKPADQGGLNASFMEYCAKTEERDAVLRSGAHFSVQFPCPVFESFYQKEFEARLSLADATATIKAETAFAKTKINAFASHADQTAVIRLSAELEEALSLESELKRWGSRLLIHWHGHYANNPEAGLDGTDASADDGCMCITQKLTGNCFCVAVKPVSETPLSLKKAGSRSVRALSEERKDISVTYYITVALGDDEKSAKAAAVSRLEAAEKKGAEALYQRHAAEWADFWDRSFISLPEEKDFLENLWYLNLYYANCQMRGKYPARPWNGIWSTYHDFQNWRSYLHYNLQHSTFPLEAANHPELTEGYYQYRRRQLPYAEAFAEKIMHGKGAYYTEICNMAGKMDTDILGNTIYNVTPGPQAAMGMYQHYCYTGDETFLKETALPVMKKTAEYYMDKLELGEDGYYHLYHTSAYESPFVVMDDTITDLATIRVLFEALIPFLEKEEAAIYKERLDRLAPFSAADFLPDELDENGAFAWGLGKGKKPAIGKVMSVGDNARLPDRMSEDLASPDVLEQCFGEVREHIGPVKTRVTFGNPAHTYYAFTDVEMSPVFPSGLIGIRDRDSDLYKLVYNNICLHKKDCAVWCMMPIFLARMGLTEMLEERLAHVASTYIGYPNGLADDWGHTIVHNRWYRRNSTNPATGEKGSYFEWKFHQFNYETLPILATAINEMLLQSHDGIVRLFPAIPADAQTAFKLAASGGWIVDAIFAKGECDVVIESTRGGLLSVTADHVNGPLVLRDEDSGELLQAKAEQGIYAVNAAAGQRIALRTQGAGKLSVSRKYEKNRDVKYFGQAKLGAPKDF